MHKIFIAEDSVEVARMYERAFTLKGHEIVLAHDGQQALEMLQKDPETPAAVVLDIMMPHMNGLELIRHLRQDERFKQVPIAVLTNSFYKEDAERFLTAGADLYLIKIDNQSSEVVEKIEALITSKKQ